MYANKIIRARVFYNTAVDQGKPFLVSVTPLGICSGTLTI